MRAVLFFLLFSGWSASGHGRQADPFDYKQAIIQYSSNEYLNKMFHSSVEQRSKRLFTFVKSSIAQNEKMLFKNKLSEHQVPGLLDNLDLELLLLRWKMKK